MIGVPGSALGRYFLALYMPLVSAKIFNPQKEADLHFLGTKLSGKKLRMHLFVLLYTLLPIPSTPLFTVAGLSNINPIQIIPAFIIGKFISDTLMVQAGKFAADNLNILFHGFLSWHTALATLLGVGLLLCILFINWKLLIQEKKFKFNFRIWK